jgi:ABC-type polysaccharide/polyol phosphate export permease
MNSPVFKNCTVRGVPNYFASVSSFGFYTKLPQGRPAWQAIFLPYQPFVWLAFVISFALFFAFLGSIYRDPQSYQVVFNWMTLTLIGKGRLLHIEPPL